VVATLHSRFELLWISGDGGAVRNWSRTCGLDVFCNQSLADCGGARSGYLAGGGLAELVAGKGAHLLWRVLQGLSYWDHAAAIELRNISLWLK
jgi:hypothetical protein